MSLPWPDRLAYKMVSFVPGKVNVNGFEEKKGFHLNRTLQTIFLSGELS